MLCTFRHKIALDVLESRKQYLISASGPEKNIKEQRIKLSLAHIGNDPMTHKSFFFCGPEILSQFRISPDNHKSS